MSIEIKAYTENYKEEVIELILSIQRQEFHIPITREDQPDLSDIANFYQVKSGNFWLALYEKQVVGTISLIDIGNQQGALRKMFVKADFRGSKYNVAKSLLQQLILWAKDHRMQEVYLGTTAKFLAAHRFYEKNDFALVDKETLPAAFPVMKVDTRFYKRKL